MHDTPDQDAFLADWGTLSAFGAVPGTIGVDRQAATPADAEQRRWLQQLLAGWGFDVRRDRIGNLFGLWEFTPGAPYILTGSHLDSQPTAGRFDGAYGVLASAHAAARLVARAKREGWTPRFNLAVVDWFNEEGSRFKPSMMGSGVFTGKLALEAALETRDPAGTSVREALDAIDERGDFEGLDVAGYAEIHVQQGRSMAEDGVTIGLVEATWGARKFEFRVTGEQAHSGSTLMADRRDALLGAARLIVAARDLADAFAPGELHTAVGEIQVYPNSPVVVASEATILLDLRSASAEVLRVATERLMRTVAEVQAADRVAISIVAEHRWDRNPYPDEGVELARRVAETQGVPHARIMTVAGHDSTNMKDVTPTVMLFVPSVGGVSHNVGEYTEDADLLAGVDHLADVIAELLDGALPADATHR